jgi:hypothetical protein
VGDSIHHLIALEKDDRNGDDRDAITGSALQQNLTNAPLVAMRLRGERLARSGI